MSLQGKAAKSNMADKADRRGERTSEFQRPYRSDETYNTHENSSEAKHKYVYSK